MTHYGDSCFEAASALPLDSGLGRPRRFAGLLAAIVQRPRRVIALIRLIARTRSERIRLSDSPAGQALRHHFDQRFLGLLPQNRLCRGVLLLPNDHASYLRGRHRQALRTNLRRAACAGIRCRVIAEPSRALEAAREVVYQRRAAPDESALANLASGWPALFARPHTTLIVANDPHGHALAVLAAVIDSAVCLIQVAVASNHEARWALHDHLVRVLIARRVSYLLAEGDGPFRALGFGAGMQHYQRLLGYELRHLVPASPPRRALVAGRKRRGTSICSDGLGALPARAGEDGPRPR
jgi:hypothetical protein